MTDDRINAILDEISKVIVGKQLILKRVLASLWYQWPYFIS